VHNQRRAVRETALGSIEQTTGWERGVATTDSATRTSFAIAPVEPVLDGEEVIGPPQSSAWSGVAVARRSSRQRRLSDFGMSASDGYASPSTDSSATAIVLVGGPRLVRVTLAALIEAQPDFQAELTVGSVAELEALDRSWSAHCEVVILDVDDYRRGCAEAVDRLIAIGLGCKLVLLCAKPTDEIIMCASTRPVDGVVLKESSVDELCDAITHILTGHTVMPVRWRAVPELLTLTPRQTDVLKLIAEGHSNGEIADILGLRPNTIKFYVSEIFRRLGVHNRIEAIAHVDMREGVLTR
jgi:DNA-binding NarL/FixJ family response regulator